MQTCNDSVPFTHQKEDKKEEGLNCEKYVGNCVIGPIDASKQEHCPDFGPWTLRLKMGASEYSCGYLQ